MGDRIEAKLAELFDRVESLLQENRFEVPSVAHALETHKTLAGEDVIAVIEGIEGPLVDGWIYATQEMHDKLAAYHELAAAAHRQHSQVEASLQMLTLTHVPDAEETIDVNGSSEDPPPA